MQIPARSAPAQANTKPIGPSHDGSDSASLASSGLIEMASQVHSYTNAAE